MAPNNQKGVENTAYVIDTDEATDVGKQAPAKPSDAVKTPDVKRQQWNNPIEFLLSCVAMSVGLGNIWRFPFVAYENGGGAFLIPYILVLIFIGKPLYYMELCLGQFASAGAVKVWELSPAFRGVGYGQAIATWSVVTYYVSLMALTVFYFFSSFSSVLPWAECGEVWSTRYCVHATTNHSLLTFNASLAKSSSEEFFVNEVLKTDFSGLDNGISAPEWRLSLCLLFSWLLLFLVLVKGVASSGKVAYFTALFPYLVLFIMLARGATLPGAVDGILFFLRPQWWKLLEVKVWYAALSQSFFSLSVGFGSIIMFSSYNGFRHNVYRDATIISITDTFTSFLAGLTIFSILGYLANELGVEVKDVLKGGGSTLAFVSYPDVLARFTFAPQFFATMFFLMLFTLGIGSASALTGCVITIICDEFPYWKKWLVTLIVCIIGFLMGLFYVTPQGQFILTLIDHYGGGFLIFILAALEIVAVQWVYGINNFCKDIEFMLNRKTGYYWKFCWAVFIPLVLIGVFLYTVATAKPLQHGSYTFGPNAIGFGLALTAIAAATFPALFLYEFIKRSKKSSSLLEALKDTFKPSKHWGPRDPSLRKNYRDFLAGNSPDVPMEGIHNLGNDVEIHRF
ncbi:Sodium:neurotransmitter symporter [Trinorchestia longiramus]|nr:Sodium:neurotransmitter symporter [Trinorchestia longiramus]